MIYLNILDTKRQEFFNEISFLKEYGFYLAGGTGLALLLGHRDSIDFDFFCEGDIDTLKLDALLQEKFKTRLKKVQDEKNTLTYIVDETIKLSLFGYQYPLLENLIETNSVPIASVIDIGCMKLSAVTSRATNKDYIDLYFILKQIPFNQLIEECSKKLPTLDSMLIKKSLVYFDDIVFEEIMYKNNLEVSFEEVKRFLLNIVK